jgi:hypothetical protein
MQSNQRKMQKKITNKHCAELPEDKQCKCINPIWAFKNHSLKTDGSHFNYCLSCEKFKNIKGKG